MSPRHREGYQPPQETESASNVMHLDDLRDPNVIPKPMGILLEGDEDIPPAIMLETEEDEKELGSFELIELIEQTKDPKERGILVGMILKRDPAAIEKFYLPGQETWPAVALYLLKNIPLEQEVSEKLIEKVLVRIIQVPIHTHEGRFFLTKFIKNYPESFTPIMGIYQDKFRMQDVIRFLNGIGKNLPKEEVPRLVGQLSKMQFSKELGPNPSILKKLLSETNMSEDEFYEILSHYPKEDQEEILHGAGIQVPKIRQKKIEMEGTHEERQEIQTAEKLTRTLSEDVVNEMLGHIDGSSIFSETAKEFLKSEIAIRREEHELSQQPQALTSLGRIASDHATAVSLFHYDNRRLPSVYKSAKGEFKHAPKEDGSGDPDDLRAGIEYGDFYKREWLVAQIDRALGFHVVPTTIISSGPDGIGTIQAWRFGVSCIDMQDDWETQVDKESISRINNLDILIQNSDRNVGNFLIEPESGLVHAIDNALCFSSDPEETLYSNLFNRTRSFVTTPPTIERLRMYERSLKRQRHLKECFLFALGSTLGKEKFEEFSKRLQDQLAKAPQRGIKQTAG